MPKFSIVTIAWNNLAGLRDTAASVAEQTCRDFEWIVIDGGSTDGTVEARDAGEFELARVFVSERDKGLYDGMNKGWDHASGDYVIFMNSGDTFADAEVLADVAKEPALGSATIVYGDAWEVDGAHAVYKPAFSPRSVVYTMFAHHQSIFYRRTAVGDMRYDLSFPVGADWVLTGTLLRRGEPSHGMNRAICRFERGGVSQSRDPKVRRAIRSDRMRAMHDRFGMSWPSVVLLVGVKTAVEAVRARFPGLYDALRMRRTG